MAGRSTSSASASAMVTGEEAIIQRFLKRLSRGAKGALELSDDAAFLTPQAGHDLVLTKDALVAGVHFFADDAPADIGFKALAVNISDLAAKGARPVGYLMALILPAPPKTRWLEGLAEGLGQMQQLAGCQLLGGDTVRTSGPLTLTITAIGDLPGATMVRRCAGHAGDRLFVSGTIGDGALGLAMRQDRHAAVRWGMDAKSAQFLANRYLRPQPRLQLAPVLRRFARAAMDISDGLLIDCTRMASCAGLSARIDAAKVPLSAAAAAALAHDPGLLERLLTGGDDYEILAAVPAGKGAEFAAAASAAGCPVTLIGTLVETAAGEKAAGVIVADQDGNPISFSHTGYDHF